jgi:hypothetical protein
MTIIEMLSWFDIISDKESSPYFSDAEKLQFLNVAQDDYVNELVFSVYLPTLSNREGPARVYSAAESSSSGLEILEPLLVPELTLPSSEGGEITRTQINAAINTAVGHPSTYVAIDSVSKIVGSASIPVRFVRHNDFYAFQSNVFKAASANQPQYRLFKDKLQILPIGVANYKLSVVKRPRRMVFDLVTPGNNVSCELPEVAHNKIVSIALEHAFKATRDQVAYTMQKHQNETRV